MQRIYSPAPAATAFDWADRQPWSAPVLEKTLADAVGFVLAQDLVAATAIPSVAISAHDGFALQAAETLGAGDYNPLPLRLVGAGEHVNPGSAGPVFAGDPLPEGADAVLGLDQGEIRGANLDVATSIAPGEGVIQIGEECRRGQLLVPAGKRLRAQDIARLSLAGHDRLTVRQAPRVNICLAGHFQRDANGPMLTGLVRRDGGEIVATRRVRSANELTSLLISESADLTLVVGGTGYADRDFAVASLQHCGTVAVDGVTIHPGGSLILGESNGRPVMILPGTPLACLCAYDLVAARLLRRWAGRPGDLPYRQREVSLTRKLVSRIGLLEIARLRIDGDTGESLAVADDRLLSSSTRADGFTLLAENSEGYPAGCRITAYLYDEYD